MTKRLAECSGMPVRLASDLVEATQNSSAFVEFSGALERAAPVISKICDELRLLSSGPRAGLNEINQPPTQPGSSIVPGKVNPVIPEVVNQVCFQLIATTRPSRSRPRQASSNSTWPSRSSPTTCYMGC